MDWDNPTGINWAEIIYTGIKYGLGLNRDWDHPDRIG